MSYTHEEFVVDLTQVASAPSANSATKASVNTLNVIGTHHSRTGHRRSCTN